MNYIGSKASLLDFLENTILGVTGKSEGNFCDLFAGTGSVGSHFKKLGFSVTANDSQYYSYVLNKHYIQTNSSPEFQGLFRHLPGLSDHPIKTRGQFVCDTLSALPEKEGFVYRHYCPAGSKNGIERHYFSDENGLKCDAIRQEIEAWYTDGALRESEYFFLLTSLIEAVDRIANTASVYGAFLKKLKKSAQRPLKLKAAPIISSTQTHHAHHADANTLIQTLSPDILYLDPPYNQRQYGANYHVLETIAKYDNPVVYGKTGLRKDPASKSRYCSKINVKHAFSSLLDQTNAPYIFLSYNNEGLLSPGDIRTLMEKKGPYHCFSTPHTRFKADSNRQYRHTQTIEYLHVLSR